MLLKYHNDLNQITFKGMNARESNIFFAICALMKDRGSDSITLSFADLKKISNITTTDEQELVSIIKETYQKLLRVAAYYETDTTFGGFMLFDKFEGNILTRNVTISVNPRFAYMINKLTKNFTVMQLKEFTELQSTYTKILYRQLQQYKTTGMYVIELDYFRHMLDVPESYDMRKITQKILTPSLKALESIFLNLKIERIKEGRSVKRLKFTFDPFSNKDFFESEKIAGVNFGLANEGVAATELPTKKKRGRPKKNQTPPSTLLSQPTKSDLPSDDHLSLICPECDQPLSLIKSEGGNFYGHKNWRTSNCKMTFSSLEEIETYKEKIREKKKEQEKILAMANEQAEKNLWRDKIVKVLNTMAGVIDCGDIKKEKRLIQLYEEDSYRLILYTEEDFNRLVKFKNKREKR